MRISDWSSDVCSSDLCCTEAGARALRFSTSPSTGIAVRPGETIEFVSLPRIPATEKVWQTFNKERWKLKVRACYCSIFNDCWLTEGMQGLPKDRKSVV